MCTPAHASGWPIVKTVCALQLDYTTTRQNNSVLEKEYSKCGIAVCEGVCV